VKRLSLAVVLAVLALSGARADEPVSFCVDPDWAPFEIVNERGEHEGIAADLLRLVAARSGVSLRLVRTRDWDDSVAAVEDGRCEFLDFLNDTPKRRETLIFTDPVFTDANVIVAREEHSYIDDLNALDGETIVLPRGTSIEERVRRDFPDLRVLTVESEEETFALVAERKADLTIRSMAVAVYTIKKDGWFNLKIAGQIPEYKNRLRIGVRKDNVALRDTLNRGVAALSPAEIREIANRHTAINVQSGTDYRVVRNVIIFFSLLLVTNLLWAVKLKRVNERLRVLAETDHLTGLANRAKLSERIHDELENARRYGTSLAAILLDLDHFKAVNDDFGHLAGDRILVAVSRAVSSSLNGGETVGRWGGEEYLILCPGLDAEGARALAERVREGVLAQTYEIGRPQSVSAGVGVYSAGDDAGALIARADQALYEAKAAGRNRVRVG